MELIDSLLNTLENSADDEAVQETLGEIKSHLIQFAAGSTRVLKSNEFYNAAKS